MEINANPSMNMFLEKYNEEGEYERTLSELDKYLKCLVIEDAIKIVKAKKPLDDLGTYQKILPSNDEQESRYYIWDRVREIFSKLAGVKKTDSITASQFQKLGRFPTLIRPHFSKANFDIVFKEATHKNETNYMSCEEFYNALEMWVQKIYESGYNYQNLKDYVDEIEKVLKNS